MKQLIILALLALPSLTMAQSEWEVPTKTQTQTTVKEQKEKKQKKSGDTKESKETKADAAASEPKLKIDKKYAAGAVPLVDGKVEWQYDIAVPGKSAQQLYDMTLDALNSLTKESCQKDDSRITAVNQKEHIIAAKLDEYLVFHSAALSKDQTDFRYTIIATCSDGKVTLRLCRISYAYEMNRDTGQIYTAEEWITDDAALNKKRTNTYRLNGKFRKKTIDRKDVIFQTIESKLKG